MAQKVHLWGYYIKRLATLTSGLMRNSKQHVVENINDLPKHV